MTIHECKEYGAGPCLNENLIGEIAEANATLADRIAALEAENAALKSERDAYRSQFWDNALPGLTEMRKQRDAARAAFNVMDGCYKQAVAERDSETRWACHYFTKWQTARQSRARLVRLVRAKNGEFNHLMKLWDEARAWAAGWRRKAMKSHAMYVHMHAIYHRSNGSANIFGVPYETVVDNALKLFSRAISGTAQQERSWRRMEVAYELWDAAQAERDAARAWAAMWKRRAKAYRYNAKCLDREADNLYKSCNEARAWAAAWKRAATFWRGWRDMPYTYCRDRDFVFGRARRAAEAAEAQERR